MGRKNKNGRSRPHVNKYINQKGRLLRKQRTARTEKSAQKEALRQDTQQQNSPQQMVQRFEIWFAELGDHFGSSVQSGSRPVLVISNDVANRFSSTLTVIPLTTVQKKLNLPTHIQIAEADCQMINDHAYLRNSVALAEQVTTIGKNALLNKLGSLTSTAKQREVEQAIAVFFNMGTADITKKEARTW
ncbi:type II toxin-antitoxin system PemK/MazF family toxin [Gemmiger formicilis]|uniref:type II toxin-antitoxin system PemK/MazF family toxin n=1 Tax=Gemmiger formicilis TaxID=745368 RepID=UPI0022DFB0C8|nr:type II toxin-antitoxin system PemK/MazF family toxin [Gemmiger formicilis]